MDTIKNKIIRPFKITGNWVAQAKRLKEKFDQLTDADLKFEAGQEVELLSRVGMRLNKRHGEIIDLIRKGQAQIYNSL